MRRRPRPLSPRRPKPRRHDPRGVRPAHARGARRLPPAARAAAAPLRPGRRLPAARGADAPAESLHCDRPRARRRRRGRSVLGRRARAPPQRLPRARRRRGRERRAPRAADPPRAARRARRRERGRRAHAPRPARADRQPRPPRPAAHDAHPRGSGADGARDGRGAGGRARLAPRQRTRRRRVRLSRDGAQEDLLVHDHLAEPRRRAHRHAQRPRPRPLHPLRLLPGSSLPDPGRPPEPPRRPCPLRQGDRRRHLGGEADGHADPPARRGERRRARAARRLPRPAARRAVGRRRRVAARPHGRARLGAANLHKKARPEVVHRVTKLANEVYVERLLDPIGKPHLRSLDRVLASAPRPEIDCVVVNNVGIKVSYNPRTHDSTVISVGLVQKPLAKMVDDLDPYLWSKCSDFFERSEPVDPVDYKPLGGRVAANGEVWQMYERFALPGAVFENILNIRFTVSATEILAKYWLFDSLLFEFGALQLPGVLERDSGYVRAREIRSNWTKVSMKKTIRYRDLTPDDGPEGGIDAGQWLNYVAPAMLGLWIDDASQARICCKD